jgi:uncharacterized protein YjbI with pentapeptide repeats
MRELNELPYARFLQPLDGDPESEGDYDCVRIDDREYQQIDASHARFNESALSRVMFAGGTIAQTRFTSVWLRQVGMTGTSVSGTNWQDGEVIESAWAGVEAIWLQARRVTFENCKFDVVNWRSATLREVTFRDCVLRDNDFGEATLSSVDFPGSRVDGLLLHNARLDRVDLRAAASLSVAGGIDAMRGATISSGQLLDLAPSFAAALGLIVEDSGSR